ncbi:MAG: hypothetical protein U0Y68_20830 [Blastocatellia bacterium]
MWQGYFTKDSVYAKTEQQLIAAYKNGDQASVKGGKKQYFDLFQAPLKTRLAAISVKSLNLPPKTKAKPTGAPPAPGAFQGDRAPASYDSDLPLTEQFRQIGVGQ